jgi:(p)ppGpp synthase/HD superfamily hydrolase
MKHLDEALLLAIKAHKGQKRKGTSIPYIAHPLAVTAIALEYGADDEQAVAAMLHDVIEDGGMHYAMVINTYFGDRVFNMVSTLTNTGKGTWKENKVTYLNHLREASDDALLVAGADKLHNARSILADQQALGDEAFGKFKAGKADVLWYYVSLAGIFTTRDVPMAAEFNNIVQQMGEL